MPLAFVRLAMFAGLFFTVSRALADGKLTPPRDYAGSLEESSQEAILVFEAGDDERPSRQDMILKITVQGDALSEFAWIIPFPAPPEIHKEDPALFRELFEYVESRRPRGSAGSKPTAAAGEEAKSEAVAVEVISRKTVGAFDTAVVRETEAGALNQWLKAEGFRTLDDAEDVLGFYHQKSYVFACIKVSDAALSKGRSVDLHPLRFSFSSGGRDGIYFPMKLTGLQSEPFHVNLYVFHRFWINDRLSPFGYAHRDFELRYRDWDTPACAPNGGKDYSHPSSDLFLKPYAGRLSAVTELLGRRHADQRFYLTNIQSRNVRPAAVRAWKDDLWIFPYYTNRSFVPHDARPNGVASAGWPGATPSNDSTATASSRFPTPTHWAIAAAGIVGIACGIAIGRRWSPAK